MIPLLLFLLCSRHGSDLGGLSNWRTDRIALGTVSSAQALLSAHRDIRLKLSYAPPACDRWWLRATSDCHQNKLVSLCSAFNGPTWT